MKKALIAGAASAVLAAMPMAGVFAELSDRNTVEDTIQLTVNKTCKMQSEAAGATKNLGEAVAGNTYAVQTGTSMTITCNSVKGWTLSAAVTALTDKAASGATSQTIPFGAYPASIVPNTTTSVWSAGIALSGNDTSNATIASGWNSTGEGAFGASAGGTILSSVSDTAVNALVVTPSYKAYASNNQANATYEGTITYTFAENS